MITNADFSKDLLDINTITNKATVDRAIGFLARVEQRDSSDDRSYFRLRFRDVNGFGIIGRMFVDMENFAETAGRIFAMEDKLVILNYEQDYHFGSLELKVTDMKIVKPEIAMSIMSTYGKTPVNAVKELHDIKECLAQALTGKVADDLLDDYTSEMFTSFRHDDIGGGATGAILPVLSKTLQAVYYAKVSPSVVGGFVTALSQWVYCNTQDSDEFEIFYPSALVNCIRKLTDSEQSLAKPIRMCGMLLIGQTTNITPDAYTIVQLFNTFKLQSSMETAMKFIPDGGKKQWGEFSLRK